MARYIDAELLETEVLKPHIYDINRDDIVALIAEQPTADVVEVKRGKNISKRHLFDEFVCSECGFICEDYLGILKVDGVIYHYECEFNYCPNCGAKMDGGEKDEDLC